MMVNQRCITVFARVFPSEAVLQLWAMVAHHGRLVLCRVVAAVLALLRPAILEVCERDSDGGLRKGVARAGERGGVHDVADWDLWGVLILQRTLRRAIVVEQGKLYPFVPAAHPWPSEHMHWGLSHASRCLPSCSLHPKLPSSSLPFPCGAAGSTPSGVTLTPPAQTVCLKEGLGGALLGDVQPFPPAPTAPNRLYPPGIASQPPVQPPVAAFAATLNPPPPRVQATPMSQQH